MNVLTLDAKTYHIPSSWGELTKEQAKKLAAITFMDFQPLRKREMIFFVLIDHLSLAARLMIEHFYFKNATPEDKYDLLLLVDPISEKREIKQNLLPFFTLQSVRYFAPKNDLTDMSIWEYIQAEDAFLSYVQEGKREFLTRLIAILYRPEHPQRDTYGNRQRIPFSAGGTTEREEVFQKLPADDAALILMWFDYTRGFLIKVFRHLFPEASEKKRKVLTKVTAKKNWIMVLNDLSPNMAEFGEMQRTPVLIAMQDIDHRIRRAKEQAIQAEKIKRNRK